MFYGPLPIELLIEKTHAMGCEPFRDPRNNQMFKRFYFDVEAIVNPAATTWRRIGPTAQRQSVLPTRTHEVLRQKLLEERLVLTVTDHIGVPNNPLTIPPNNILLRSPNGNDVTDATGGPLPERCDILEVIGDKSMRVRWVIRTDVVEQEKWCVDGDPIMLSSTWKMSAGINERLQDTFIYNGRAVFHENYLQRNSYSPDDFRKWLIPPAAVGMRRMDTSADLEEDGRTLICQITDISTRHHYRGALGVTHVEVKNGYTENRDDPILGAALTSVQVADLYRREASKKNTQKDIVAHTAYSSPPIKYLPDGLVGVALSSVSRVLPTKTRWCVVRVWGAPSCQQGTLKTTALKVLVYRMASVYGINLNASGLEAALGSVYNYEEVHDPDENFLEIRLQLTENIIQNVATGGATGPGSFLGGGIGGAGLLNLSGNPQTTGQTLSALINSLALRMRPVDHIHNENFPFAQGVPLRGIHLPLLESGARQKFLGLVTQVLKGACGAPGSVQTLTRPNVGPDPTLTFD